jgi:hypothetical protein
MVQNRQQTDACRTKDDNTRRHRPLMAGFDRHGTHGPLGTAWPWGSAPGTLAPP